ncbi:hypothetical protein [Nocardia sp. NPDC056100]|uniref:hypothetical protein n=1 Tax=Nocardia sp. NPDC056100 TaxID=3345712 RepID=UPI0035D7783F
MPAATIYTCRVTNWRMFWFNAVILAGTCWPLLVPPHPRIGTTLLAVTVVISFVLSVAAISQRVTAGPAGLMVSLGPLGLPRVRVARANINHAEAVYLSSTAWLSDGVLWRGKQGWFLTPKRGPSLRMSLASGRTLTVAMPEPGAALWAMGIAP